VRIPQGRPSRKLPKPFQRPSVTVHNHGRVWDDSVPVKVLRKGDIVAEFGELVRDPEETEPGWFRVESPTQSLVRSGDYLVKAFVHSNWIGELNE
jgi:hypothetical protein